MAAHLDEAEKQILGALLRDFSDRNLSANDLDKGYEGPKISELKAAICTVDEISHVDFDLAFEDLEKNKLIITGPRKSYDNDPYSSVFIISSYSLREYASLTDAGYKTARKPPNRPTKPQRVVNNVHISGGQFSNTQFATGGSVTQKFRSESGVNSEILSKLISILEKQGQVVSVAHREDLTTAIDRANAGDGLEAKKLLKKVCGSVWESVQSTMWPILGELVKRSLGI